jgi:hypothetical protein
VFVKAPNADKSIQTHVTFKRLEELPNLVEEMKVNKVRWRVGVLFTEPDSQPSSQHCLNI